MGESTEMNSTEAGSSEGGSSQAGSSQAGDPDVVVVRCGACGDTFPVHEPVEGSTCPSCGSEDVHQASEPLL